MRTCQALDLNDIPDNEPVFHLRGADPVAVEAMCYYADKQRLLVGHEADGYVRHAQAMRDWLSAARGAQQEKSAALRKDAAPVRTSPQGHRYISRDRMLAVGLHPKAVDYVFENADRRMLQGDAVRWDELVQIDGMLAVNALEADDVHALAEELREQGAPIAFANAAQIAHYVYAAASMYVPEGEWARRELQSAVAAGLLLKLAQAAWSRTRVIVAPPSH